MGPVCDLFDPSVTTGAAVPVLSPVAGGLLGQLRWFVPASAASLRRTVPATLGLCPGFETRFLLRLTSAFHQPQHHRESGPDQDGITISSSLLL